MKERSLENQYRMLEALKRRFDATEIVGPGFERARQYAELAEGEHLLGGVSPQAAAPVQRAVATPSASPAIQPPLFEEAA